MAVSAIGSQARPQRLPFQPRWPSRLTFPLVLLLIIACFYWKLILTYQFDWVWGPDMADQVLPWWEEEARQLQHSHFPLWDPHNWMGQPFLGQAQPGAAYPLNWLLWLMPRHQGHIQVWVLQWYFVVVHYMAALFCYLLCRDLGRSRIASMIAGLAFALAGYVGWTDWPQMVNGAVWTPLVFLFLLRAVRGLHAWANAALSGVALGMAWLSGHHQVPIFLTLASGGVWLYYILRDKRPDWRIARLAVVAMLFAPLVGALQILPAQEYGRLAWRWAGAARPLGWDDVVPYYVHTQHALHPIYLFGVLIPGFDQNAGPFFGVVAVTLALLGIAICWREHSVKLFAAVALGGLIYSLGPNSIYQGFLYAVVPFVEKARVPAMATLLFHAGLAILAAFGVDALQPSAQSPPEDSPWVRRINLGVLVFAIVTAITAMAILLAKRFQWDTDDRVMVTMLVAVLMAALIYAWRKGSLTRRQAVTLLTLLLLFEVGDETSYRLADRNDWGRRNFLEKAWGNRDIADFLNAQPKPFRIESQTDDIVRNWGDFYNLDFPSAQAGVTVNTYHLETHTPPTKKLLGTKYTLARAPTDPAQHEVFRGASGIAVYENPDVFPRAWTVHEIIPIRDEPHGRKFINDSVDELRSKAFMDGEAPKLACPGTADDVTITKYQPENVAIHADMRCQGMLVLSETYYPGWYARVDGRPANIYEVDFALRGVVVPQGAHEITFQYRPRSVIWGATLTLAGWLGAAALVMYSRKPRHPGKNRHLAQKRH